jgi:hypothetical protein
MDVEVVPDEHDWPAELLAADSDDGCLSAAAQVRAMGGVIEEPFSSLV